MFIPIPTAQNSNQCRLESKIFTILYEITQIFTDSISSASQVFPTLLPSVNGFNSFFKCWLATSQSSKIILSAEIDVVRHILVRKYINESRDSLYQWLGPH